ncbi:AraC family transcriptional regulator [uncultured Maribacter sp.]|uniref:helix-turn-helix domain-containing protein n=1 Tax=uncultured Maribacter sp. TaxID=431308 RepID=UPI0026051816|nr:AraC family transcriptional regulator [uncultured Maribacter sp.]
MIELLQTLKLNLLHAGYAKLDNKWDYDRVISPFTRMFYVTKGTADVYHSNIKFYLKPGYIYLIPSYVYNRYKCDNYHEQYYVGFFEEVQHGLSVYNLKRFKYEIKASEADIELFKRLLVINPNREVLNSDPDAYIHNEATMLGFNIENNQLSADLLLETTGILTILFSKFMEHGSLVLSEDTGSVSIEKVLSYIADNLQEKISITELAKYCNLNVDYFSRIFKEKFGVRPNSYIQLRRVERAQFLLLTTQDSLKEISEKVGLGNMSYFSRTFKKITGNTPANFRKQQLSK